jgi:hypothetical protein
VNAREWIAAYAHRVGVAEPSTDEFKQLLDLAGEAAHSSERVAAPVACWVAAKAGLTPAEALDAARDIGDDG